MSQDDQAKKKKRLQAGLALVAISAVVIGVAVATPTKSLSSSLASSTVTTTQSKVVANSNTAASGATQPTTAIKSSYKDGSYSATGEYFSPGGQESLKVSLTIASDVVTTASVQSGANDPTAMTYQTSFIGGYKHYVVGKKINTIKLSNVSGSSLTSQGFNDALKQIEHQAAV